MDVKALARNINENAVVHGWWEGEHSFAEKIALIHSEWSEALEEYRAGRPMVWHQCINRDMPCDKDAHCVDAGRESVMCIGQECCKPEGIAVELLDGCIRIFDTAVHYGIDIDPNVPFDEQALRQYSLPDLVALLHLEISSAMIDETIEGAEKAGRGFSNAVSIVFIYLREHGVDPEAVMLEKHRYNKTRSYRHGGKLC